MKAAPSTPRGKGRPGTAGRVVHTKSHRSKTRRIGVYLVKLTPCASRKRTYLYFCALLGSRPRMFSVLQLGRDEAWRAALRCRMRWEHEARVRAAAAGEARRAKQNAAAVARERANPGAARARRCAREAATQDSPRYTYLGARGTRPELIGAQCDPVRNAAGRCVISRSMGTALVRFTDGTLGVVVRRRLRLNRKEAR